jgi:hypothetical protein
LGKVAALDEIGGYYRVHGANRHEDTQLDLRQMRQLLVRTEQTHGYMRTTALELGLLGGAESIAPLALTFPANRLVSLRLDPAQHPFPGDTRVGLARWGVQAAWRRDDLPRLLRLSYMAWFLLCAAAPKPVVRRLAELLFYPEAQGKWFKRRLANLRRPRSIQADERQAAP